MPRHPRIMGALAKETQICLTQTINGVNLTTLNLHG